MTESGNEAPRVIKTVMGIDPVRIGVHALVSYHRAVYDDSGSLDAADRDRIVARGLLTQDQQDAALDIANRIIAENYPSNEPNNP